jgi:uncharacterized membrane protein YqiK
MSYRDDRHALRERAETLERELEATRGELERLRSEGASHASSASAPRPSSNTAFVVATLLAAGVVLTLPLPMPAKVVAVGLAATLLGMLVMLSALVVLARPAQALVLSGTPRRSVDGSRIGFRAVVGGRALRVPLVERPAALELGMFRVPLALRGARDRSGRAVEADLIAHARIRPGGSELERAVERFLGTDSGERARVVATALEPVLRRVLAGLDLAELGEERARVADLAQREAQEALDPLGIELASLFLVRLESGGA